MKQNKSRARGCNSEDIATDISTCVIVMLTNVIMLREQDLAPSWTPEVSAKPWRDNCDMRRTQAKELDNLNDTKNGTANL